MQKHANCKASPTGRLTSWLKTASLLNTAPAPTTNAFGYNLSDEVTSYESKNTSTNATLDAQTWAYATGSALALAIPLT